MFSRLIGSAAVAFCLTMSTGAALAQDAGADNDAFKKEMHASMAKMEKEMKAVPMTGNPDRDFAAMMIPHHQGAMDMARLELKYGKDEKLRALAQEILRTQEKEINTMEEQLKKLPAPSSETTHSMMMQHDMPMMQHDMHKM